MDENGDADLYPDSNHHSDHDEYQYGHEDHDANNDLDQISNSHLYQDHVEYTHKYAYTHRKYHEELHAYRNAYGHPYIYLNDVGDEHFHAFANDIPHQQLHLYHNTKFNGHSNSHANRHLQWMRPTVATMEYFPRERRHSGLWHNHLYGPILADSVQCSSGIPKRGTDQYLVGRHLRWCPGHGNQSSQRAHLYIEL